MHIRIAAVLALLALGLVIGCGGDDDKTAQTVPTAPELTVPGEDETPTITDSDRGGRRDRTSTTGEGGTVTPAPSTGGATPTPPSQPQQPSGGAPAPGQGQDAPGNDRAPSSPQEGRFEQFCQDNPGAC